jgi:hypothetical protein
MDPTGPPVHRSLVTQAGFFHLSQDYLGGGHPLRSGIAVTLQFFDFTFTAERTIALNGLFLWNNSRGACLKKSKKVVDYLPHLWHILS